MGGGARPGAAGRLSGDDGGAIGGPRRAAAPAAVRIRPAADADMAAVAAIERASFGDPWSERSFRELARRPEATFLVAEVDVVDEDPRAAHRARRVVGYAVAWFVVGEGEVANLAVDSRFRGRRVGASLLDALLVAAEAAGVSAMYLEVRESNEPARALYASRAFEIVGRRPHYYRSPREDALLLRRGPAPANG